MSIQPDFPFEVVKGPFCYFAALFLFDTMKNRDYRMAVKDATHRRLTVGKIRASFAVWTGDVSLDSHLASANLRRKVHDLFVRSKRAAHICFLINRLPSRPRPRTEGLEEYRESEMLDSCWSFVPSSCKSFNKRGM